MKNKGFTLVELLAVVAILALVITIVAPKIFSQFKTAEETSDREQINSLIEASRIYMNQNTNLLPEGNNEYVISLRELKNSGIIQTKQILNPSTKQELNGCIVVKYVNNKYDYQYKEFNDCNKPVIVTFDSNGGEIDTPTKTVSAGQPYGLLPEPEKDGYTFLGWTKDNILNLSGWLNGFSAVTRGTIVKGDNWLTLTATSNDSYTNTYGSGTYQIPVESNTEYVLTWESDSNKSGLVYVFLNGSTTASNTRTKNNNEGKSLTFTTAANTTYINIRFGVATKGDTITYSNMYIKKSSALQEFEPYYITNTTKVLDENNHILKAEFRQNAS